LFSFLGLEDKKYNKDNFIKKILSGFMALRETQLVK